MVQRVVYPRQALDKTVALQDGLIADIILRSIVLRQESVVDVLCVDGEYATFTWYSRILDSYQLIKHQPELAKTEFWQVPRTELN